MSYRELRDAVEILRILQYPRLVSIENFRLPNFPLMAEMLEWTVRKFDPNYRIPKQIDTEAQRVLFVKACVLALIQKARVKLNPKNLYQSDGYAVRELLPVLRLLHESTKKAEVDTGEDRARIQQLRTQIQAKRHEIREFVEKVAEVPQTSATLYDLLAKEIFAREARLQALSQSLNVKDVEKTLRKMITDSKEQEEEFTQKLDNLSTDEETLDGKVERRQREYDQLQKRLAKLQSFRPPYMDEYDQLEAQLNLLYQEYVVQFRNLAYLQEQLDNVEQAEVERSHEVERSMRLDVEKMRQENDKVPLITGINLEEVKEKAIRVYGNMTGAGLSSDEEDDDDEDEEVDALHESQMNINELADADSDSDENEPAVMEMGRPSTANRQRPQSAAFRGSSAANGMDIAVIGPPNGSSRRASANSRDSTRNDVVEMNDEEHSEQHADANYELREADSDDDF